MGTPPTTGPARLLVVRLGAIGDVVNALVTATALKRHQPGLHVGWAVHELSRPLVERHPAVDQVHVWRRERPIRGALAILREVRAARYDVAIDLSRIAKSAALARFSGARRVIGFDRARAKEWSWLLTREHIAPRDAGAHMVEQYLEFARHLGVDDPTPEFLLPIDDRAETWAAEYIQQLGDDPILINLGASRPSKSWRPERFGDLAREVRRRFHRPVMLTGGPSDRALAERAKARIPSAAEIIDMVGSTSLPELAALQRRCALFIGCDTGPLHLASACGAPVLALFGPGDPRRTGPFGQLDSVVRVPPPCAPCNLRRCNQPRHACMDDIEVDAVLAEIETRLALASVPSR